MRLPRTLLPAAVLISAAVIVPGSVGRAVASGHSRSDSIAISIDSVTPLTPTPTTKRAALAVTLTLTNRSSTAYHDVRITGERGEPIGTQDALDAALANTTTGPTSFALTIPAQPALRVDLDAGASQTVIFETTTSIIDGSAGICLCAEHEIYPLFFSAHVTGEGGVDQRLGVAETFLPSFYTAPAPVHVSWIWPLLERPHRLNDDTVFTDDLLAERVGPAGRLDRALQVVEEVGDRIPMTLVIDPELLDELEVMATLPYTVDVEGKQTPGTGKSVARQWLDRFATVLATEPKVHVQLTPYADPDVESLASNGLDWSLELPAAMATRVSHALGDRAVASTLAWPASGYISRDTMLTLTQDGVSTLVLSSRAVDTGKGNSSTAPGFARLEVAQHDDVAAALLYPAIQRYVARAVTIGGQPPTTLPQLLAELAIRTAQEPDVAPGAVALAPPRYVDPDVTAAVQAITETSTSTFSSPISLSAAVGGSFLPTGGSRLASVPPTASGLPVATIDAVQRAQTAVPTIASMLDTQGDPAAQALIDSLPVGIQRAESSAWQESRSEADGTRFAAALLERIDAITSGVRIVTKSTGSYTLASDNSPLPITVENRLPYRVQIRIHVSTVNGLPGFRADDVDTTVDANQKRSLNIPTKTDRSGRIPLRAVLLTLDNAEIGQPVTLTVRSTALGVIGIVITIVAGVVLVLALLIRFARRFRAKRAPTAAPPDAPVPIDEREPIP